MDRSVQVERAGAVVLSHLQPGSYDAYDSSSCNGSPAEQNPLVSRESITFHGHTCARPRKRASANGPHRLQHTFCSLLAMRGAPPRAVQELAGLQDLTTTQRYTHLSPASLENAIQLLERPSTAKKLET
jgi:integrase